MTDFDGVDRSTCTSLVGSAEPAPLTIELIRRGCARMMAWRPPPPYIPRLTDEICSILWTHYAAEVRDLVAHGVRGREIARRLASVTPMGYEIAAGFVEFLESQRARPSLADLEREPAMLPWREYHAAGGMVSPRNQRAKPAPPVPPWARERRRHR